MRVKPGHRQHGDDNLPAPLLHHFSACQFEVTAHRRFQRAESVPEQKRHAAPGDQRQQPRRLHQQRAAAKNPGTDQQQIAYRAQQGNHQMVLAANALIHHERILRAEGKDHGCT